MINWKVVGYRILKAAIEEIGKAINKEEKKAGLPDSDKFHIYKQIESSTSFKVDKPVHILNVNHPEGTERKLIECTGEDCAICKAGI